MKNKKDKIISKFDDSTLDIDKLSAGCKTVLNVIYNPDKVFCLKECGNNALEILYGLPSGNVCSDYALIPFNMAAVKSKPIVMEHFFTVHIGKLSMAEVYMSQLIYSKMLYKRYEMWYTSNIIKEEVIGWLKLVCV